MVDGLEDCQTLVEQLCLILGEIADLDIMPHLQFSRIGNLAHDTLHERRFSFTVLADESHFLTTFDGERHMIEHRMGAIVLAHIITDDRIVATSETRRELQVHRGVVHLVNLDGHDLLQLLDFLLHLHGLRGLIAEALDEGLHLCHFFLLVLVGPDLLFATLLAQHDVLVVLHLVVDDASTGDLQRTVRDIVDEGTVVTDEYHRT